MDLDYKEYKEILPYLKDIDLKKLRAIKESLDNLNESEVSDELKEGIIRNLIGTIGGAVIGPKIGRVIAKVLGVEKGLLYNFLTSNFVNAALGLEIAKTTGGK